MSRNEEELSIMGYNKVYDYTQFSHDNDVNVIPKEDFQHLVTDTFKTIAKILEPTYGPYGSAYLLNENVGSYATKDGFNTFESLNFAHQYKKMVYMQIKHIIERVNENVGDGTTSCILLANELFKILHETIEEKDEDYRRMLLSELDNIEAYLNKSLLNTKEDTRVNPLTTKILWNIINLASNYDEEITNSVYDALDPIFDNETGVIESIRNVTLKKQNINGIRTIREYKLSRLLGDYRITIGINPDAARDFINERKIVPIIYDHRFVEADWLELKQSYVLEHSCRADDSTKTPFSILICAPSYSINIVNTIYDMYVAKRLQYNKPIDVYLCEIKGGFVQNEIKDLAALINSPIHKLGATAINFDDEHTVDCSITGGDCLCLYNMTPPTEYIKTLQYELDHLKQDSKIIKDDFINRIRALNLQARDSIIDIYAPNALESSMVYDKMMDCVCIAKSAFNNGVVPNMLVYGSKLLSDYNETQESEISKSLSSQIIEAINNLFNIVWKSKYKDNNENQREYALKWLYNINGNCGNSYNIITNDFVSYSELPTSAQYDVEVLSASISIIKYLITSNGMIFDSQYLQSHGDTGHYIQQA